MKKKNINWLEKYKRISILSFFCLMCGILCLSICVVGFSLRSSNNVAYADDYNPNLFSIGWNLTRFEDTVFTGTRSGGLTDPPNFVDLTLDNSTYGGFMLTGFSGTKTLCTVSDLGFDCNFNSALGIPVSIIVFDTVSSLGLNTVYTFAINVVSASQFNNFTIVSYTGSSRITLRDSITLSLGLNVLNFSSSSSVSSDNIGISCTTPTSSFVFDKVKLEEGTNFTGWLTDYERGYEDGYQDGYNDGLSNMPLNNLPGGVYFDSFKLSDLSVGTDSFFTYNDLNYRFSYSVISSDTNYIESTVQLSWPLSSNGDTDHRYTGFSSPDNLVLPNSPILNFRTSNISRGYFICFNGSNYLGLVDISQLSPYGSYQLEINIDNTVTIYSLYVPLVTGTTSFYFVSSLDSRYSTAGDFTAFNIIDIYFLGDTFTQSDYNSIYQKGWNEGYEDAVDRNEFNFYSLFGAIYDVPIKAFDGLFNVNILGVNLKGFLLGLISLCIILFILKIVFK